MKMLPVFAKCWFWFSSWYSRRERGGGGACPDRGAPRPEGKVRRYVFPIQSEQAGSYSSHRKRLFLLCPQRRSEWTSMSST